MTERKQTTIAQFSSRTGMSGVNVDTEAQAIQAKAKNQLSILFTRLFDQMPNGPAYASKLVGELLDNDAERVILTGILDDFNNAANTVDHETKLVIENGRTVIKQNNEIVGEQG